MKIALIQPSSDHYIGFHHTAITEPLGLEAIAGVLTSHEIVMLDMRFDKDIERFLLREHPDAVGVAVPFTTVVYAGRAVLKTVRRLLPHAFTFVGGHHPALNPSDFLGRCDVVVVGEGEELVPELLNRVESGEPIDNLPGLMFIKDGEPFFTGERPLIAKLDDLPMVNRTIVERYAERYFFRSMAPVTMIETARGCPHRCIFCSVWKFNRGRYRQKSPERVLEETKAALTTDVLFADDNFMGNVSRTEHIYRLIQGIGLKKRFGCQARTDTIAKNPDMIRRWRSIGLSWVLIGFESFNQEWLAWMNKKTDVETNEEAVRILQDNGIEIQAAFIVDPTYSRSEFQALGKYIRRLKLKSCQITVLTPLPGTDLFKEKWSELTSRNYDLFDFFHAVLPTKLPLEQFYREFCKLYRRVAIMPNIKELFKSPSSLSPSNILQGIHMFNNILRPKGYLKGHSRAVSSGLDLEIKGGL
ncbi:MAG: cobalamin B12-binding domain-containing protein [Actinobacteria bacterium]|nr:cobalamin B12-binding domain-containing protein [Actinomycetota bacterium]